jgi:hypothetical protein
VIDGIVIIKGDKYMELKCCEYEPKEEPKGYSRPLQRTAVQRKSLMGFTQNY